MHVFMYVCTYFCTYVYILVCIFAHMNVCMYLYIIQGVSQNYKRLEYHHRWTSTHAHIFDDKFEPRNNKNYLIRKLLMFWSIRDSLVIFLSCKVVVDILYFFEILSRLSKTIFFIIFFFEYINMLRVPAMLSLGKKKKKEKRIQRYVLVYFMMTPVYEEK